MFKNKAVTLLGMFIWTGLASAYSLYFVHNGEFETNVAPWMTMYENPAGTPVTPGTLEWDSQHGGSAHISVSGAPSELCVAQEIGTTLYPGDTILMRVTTTDMTGFGDSYLVIGSSAGADAPFAEYVRVPDGANTYDLNIVCGYAHGPGTILSFKTIVWPGNGECWIHYIKLHRAGQDSSMSALKETPDYGSIQPSSGALLTATPNPVGRQTTLTFTLPINSSVRVTVYDLKGALVKTIEWDGTAGENRVRWDGTDQVNRRLPEGIYGFKVSAAGKPAGEGKLVLAK